LPRLGRQGRLRLHRHREWARPHASDDAGPPGAARAQAEALLDQLSPARAAAGRAARPAPVLGRRGRARAERDLRLADLRLARARAVRPDGDRLRGPPEPRAAAHARGLGGPPAAQGLSDRRRARPLQRRAMSATVTPTTTRRWPVV